MLTSIYYYGYYKPYMVKDGNHATAKNTKQKEAPAFHKLDDVYGKDYNVQLNKALKRDIQQYARDIYQNIIGIKNLSKTMLDNSNDIVNYNKNAKNGEDAPSFQEAIDYYYDDLEDFVSQYNKTNHFSSRDNAGGDLAEFSNKMNSSLESLKRGLRAVGLRQNEDGSLYINEKTKEKIKSKSRGEVKSIIGDEQSFFSHIYNESRRVLENPMSKHMNFQNLKYFYNYDYDTIENNTFRLIESGMLLDLAL